MNIHTYVLPKPLILFTLLAGLIRAITASATPQVIYLDQGKAWNDSNRHAFYSQDQGSQVIPLKWIQALKQTNGAAFLADDLNRYGYLSNPASPTPGLPVGFTVNGDHLGITCAACHVRQIQVDGKIYRVDGGPAITDFQSFARDLGLAVQNILGDAKQFAAFADQILGKTATAPQTAELHKQVEDWNLPYATIMSRSLPVDQPWGPARLDAVGMIFNRLTGLDIGTSPDHIIAENILKADVPVRYPFLWNAPIQDKTQWSAFADNGNALLGLSRNLGEVIGVFNHFYPEKDPGQLVLGVNYLKTNTANFHGLSTLEDLIKKIGPPRWPWLTGPYAVDQKLAAQGQAIYQSATKTEAGGCAGCHGIRQGAMRSFQKTWATPICDVQTDIRQFELLNRTAKTGVLAGAKIPFLDKPALKAEDEPAINILGLAVIGSILQHDTKLGMDLEAFTEHELEKIPALTGIKTTQVLQSHAEKLKLLQTRFIKQGFTDLQGAFKQHTRHEADNNSICKDDFHTISPKLGYESRVLQGIWATAPYLHNGTIPTLADLLEPVAKRTPSFKVGNEYDPGKIGLAKQQHQFDFTLQTTACDQQDSGNSRCGHEFGTKLDPAEKQALLEYLKTL
ncbi:hypothetical protein KEF85_15725 [Methylomonas paludis]|uniref:Cytochrome c domain-containing protein n=1 Tax=Methylomonas paludis TaxID=1173101 RepID=A0A975MNU0_9GAMM|nr:di-heme-cytochrome C peroxidase [Methylomonas paludis]QWF70749.1 hypothetical protein KEF85_15725 [Methylomonas paludis]